MMKYRILKVNATKQSAHGCGSEKSILRGTNRDNTMEDAWKAIEMGETDKSSKKNPFSW